jgi:hypothetical protein
MDLATPSTSATSAHVPNPPEPDWLHTLYDEAWRQYVHEGNLVYTRSSVFLAIHAALLAVLAAVAAPLFTLSAPPETNEVTPLGEFVFGSLLAVVSLFSLLLTIIWRGVVAASRTYFNLRWVTAYAVEALVPGLAPYGIAHLEHRWRAHKQRSSFIPFPWDDSIRLPPLPKIRGFNSLEHITTILLVLWGVMAIVGVLLLICGLTRL